MQDQIEGLIKHIKAQTPAMVEELVQNTNSPFTAEVMGLPLPRKFKMLQLETFNGSMDPLDHLETYKSLMHLQAVPDEVMCRAFPVTLKGSARARFNKLPLGSLRSFKELSTSFVSYFIAGQRYGKPATYLLTVKRANKAILYAKGRSGMSPRVQVPGGIWSFSPEPNGATRSLGDWPKVKIDEADDNVSITAYIAGLYSGQFLYLVSQEPPKTLAELMLRAQKHMNAEEDVYARHSRDVFDPQAGPSQVGEFPRPDKRRREAASKMGGEPKNKKVDSRSSPKQGDGGPPQGRYKQFTPLIAMAEQILSNQQDDDCIDLKQQIKDLIQRGRLQHFVTKKYQKPFRKKDTNKEGRDSTTPRSGLVGEIKVIHGGFVGGGEFSNARKAHLRKLRTEEQLEVNTVGRPSKFQKKVEVPIIFLEEDVKGVQIPHDDPLVITIVVANYLTRRVLIDSGSSADILYLHAYDQLKIGRERLRPMTSPLVGFVGTPTYSTSQIALPVTMGEEGRQITCMIDFIVVDFPSAYNAILGRTSLNKIGAIISTYHLMIKFPTSEGIGCVRGDKKAARECYITSLRGANITMKIESLDTRDEEKLQHGEPVEELIEEPLEPGQQERTIRIGMRLSTAARAELLQFLKKNKEVFAWSHEDIPGIDPRVISHKLNVDLVVRPVK
ncbi:uncharacterized protein LOC131317343 [Rhododendron vialii]|uniref:uncharacterized protein LOC131317343 n=1 Tax=Rhododendron vialii TaxID=182163 RepID=UPI00265F2D9A|nr:uncharacterized protein LOC131317343 [Rhododendron vialii]